MPGDGDAIAFTVKDVPDCATVANELHVDAPVSVSV
jgi:hypothetical protein